jgi:hypothetical protein
MIPDNLVLSFEDGGSTLNRLFHLTDPIIRCYYDTSDIPAGVRESFAPATLSCLANLYDINKRIIGMARELQASNADGGVIYQRLFDERDNLLFALVNALKSEPSLDRSLRFLILVDLAQKQEAYEAELRRPNLPPCNVIASRRFQEGCKAVERALRGDDWRQRQQQPQQQVQDESPPESH